MQRASLTTASLPTPESMHMANKQYDMWFLVAFLGCAINCILDVRSLTKYQK
jgi:hypothetical protein